MLSDIPAFSCIYTFSSIIWAKIFHLQIIFFFFKNHPILGSIFQVFQNILSSIHMIMVNYMFFFKIFFDNPNKPNLTFFHVVIRWYYVKFSGLLRKYITYRDC